MATRGKRPTATAAKGDGAPAVADIANPWDRLPSESTPAYEAARAYFEMGAERSQDAVAAKLAKSRALMSRWASANSWVERAELFDAHMYAIERNAIEQATAAEAAKWARRKVEQRETDWSIAGDLRAKAEEMLRYPLTRARTMDGTTTTIIEPIRWTMRDAVAMVDTAAKLARLAAEMATESHAESASEGAEEQKLDIIRSLASSLERIADRHQAPQ